MTFLTAMAEQKEQASLESALPALPSTSHQKTQKVSFPKATPLAVSTLSAEVTQRDASGSRCLHCCLLYTSRCV